MNKIVMNIGLLLFFLAIIFFSQRELPVYEVIVRSFTIFISTTGMLAILTIVIIRSINKKTLTKTNKPMDKLSGK